MRPERDTTSRADRQVGWLIALCSLVFIGSRIPLVLEQLADFAPWWTAAGFVAVAAFVCLAAFGRWMPITALHVLWLATPLLVMLLQLLSYAAYRVPGGSVVPWVWSLEPAAVSLLVLVLRARYAFALAVLSGTTVAISAWVFTGAIPEAIVGLTPIRMSNLAFAVIFFGIRDRLTRLHESEAAARAAAEHSARSAAETARRAGLNRLVHDEVLSVFTAAMLFRGQPPAVLRDDAGHAIAMLDTASSEPDDGRVDGRRAASQLKYRLERVSPTATIDIRGDDSTVPVAALTHLAAAMGEALRNARRHAHAENVEAKATIERGAMSAVVRDDGVGFDPATRAVGRLGVADSILGRIGDIGGTVEIVSAPGQGTEVRLAWTP